MLKSIESKAKTQGGEVMSLARTQETAMSYRQDGLDNIATDLLLMERFLASIEKRAYAVAYTALGHRDDALDAVQDTMLQLVRRYSDKTEIEWRALFYRILHNKINDTFRKRKVKDKLFAWLPWNESNEEDGRENPFDKVSSPQTNDPEAKIEQDRRIEALSAALGKLPGRQREAFVLRCWEGYSTIETAEAMACSEGSVKTHYSRAMNSLRVLLEEYQP